MGSIVQYTPQDFPILERAARRMEPNYGLLHRPFVDYYYASSEWCKLYLYLRGDEVIGTIGLDSLRFEIAGNPAMVTFATNYYALEPGAGAPLYMKWIRENPTALLYGGSEDTHRITRAQNWSYVPDVGIFQVNAPVVIYPRDKAWRSLAKRIAKPLRLGVPLQKRLKRMSAETLGRISLREEAHFTPDLLPAHSPFAFRLAPSLEYLNWRYNTDLPFVRYRIFRVLVDEETSGYVVINEGPRTMVAHCDGKDSVMLAHAILLALTEISRDDRKPRHAILTSCHDEMMPVFRQFGFKKASRGRPLAFKNLELHCPVSLDTSDWLVNLDWGDIGLRVGAESEQSAINLLARTTEAQPASRN